MYYSLFIVSSNGGLVFCKHFTAQDFLGEHECVKIASSLFTINELVGLAAHVH